MDHKKRFVFSGPGSWPLEQVLQWAVEHGFSRVDFSSDNPPNYRETFTSDRVRTIRALTEKGGIALGIHSSSAVNMAELTAVMSAAADEYLRQNFDLAREVGCGYVICHGGFHFSSDREARLARAVERMTRAVAWAEERGIDIYFENHNKEPDQAEIHYMPRDVAEIRPFFREISSPRFKWACNVGHAHMVPEGFDGFLEALGGDRIGQVRLHDTHGRYEEHLLPGNGIVDFRAVFRRLNEVGYDGPFTLDFGSPDDRAAWRDRFATLLDEEQPER